MCRAGNRRSPTASNSGRICTSKRRDNDFPPYPMLIYFAFYIFPTRVSPTHEQLENHPQLVPLTDRNCILSDVLPRKIQLTTFLSGSRPPPHQGGGEKGRSRGISCENPLDCPILAPISIILAPGNATCHRSGRGEGNATAAQCYKAILTLPPDFVGCGDEKLRAFLVICQPWRDFLL